jgi:hypothetical protein
MPRGRRPNLDKKISGLIADLKAALVQREQQSLEAQVSARVDAIVSGLTKVGGGASKTVAASAKAASAPVKRRRGWSPAAKAAARARMKAFWAAKKGKAAKRGKGTKAAAAPAK